MKADSAVRAAAALKGTALVNLVNPAKMTRRSLCPLLEVGSGPNRFIASPEKGSSEVDSFITVACFLSERQSVAHVGHCSTCLYTSTTIVGQYTYLRRVLYILLEPGC